MPNSSSLPLASHEYFALIELLIFHIALPQSGMRAAHAKLNSVPLPKKIRAKFVLRLNQLRTMVAADIHVTNSTDI